MPTGAGISSATMLSPVGRACPPEGPADQIDGLGKMVLEDPLPRAGHYQRGTRRPDRSSEATSGSRVSQAGPAR